MVMLCRLVLVCGSVGICLLLKNGSISRFLVLIGVWVVSWENLLRLRCSRFCIRL